MCAAASKFFLLVVSGSCSTIEREYRGVFNTPKLPSLLGRVGDKGFSAVLKKNCGEERERFSSFLASSVKKAQAVAISAKKEIK